MEKDKSFNELSQGRLQQTISNDDKLIALKKQELQEMQQEDVNYFHRFVVIWD